VKFIPGTSSKIKNKKLFLTIPCVFTAKLLINAAGKMELSLAKEYKTILPSKRTRGLSYNFFLINANV
jgi:hypothetical protein